MSMRTNPVEAVGSGPTTGAGPSSGPAAPAIRTTFVGASAGTHSLR